MENLTKKRKDFKAMTHLLIAFLMATMIVFTHTGVVLAAGDGASVVSEGLTNLMDIVYAAVSAIGMLITLWGIVDWGTAWQGNDGIMQASAWKKIGGGIIIALAPQILPSIISV